MDGSNEDRKPRRRLDVVLVIVGVVVGFLIASRFTLCSREAEGSETTSSSVAGADLKQAINQQRELMNEMAKQLAENRLSLDKCRLRTEDLRAVLSALLPTWPGRKRLPNPGSGWPDWPAPGSSRYDYPILPLIE